MIPQKPTISSRGGASNRPSHSYRQAPIAASTNKTSNKLLVVGGAIGLIIVAVLGLLSPVLVKMYNQAHYTNESLGVEIIREAAKKPSVNLDEIFSRDNVRDMEQGKGLKVTLVTKIRGKEIHRRGILELAPWDYPEQTSNPKRRAAVAETREKLSQMINNFDINQNWVIDFILDDTDGVQPDLIQKAKAVFNKLELDDRIKIGDGVDISFSRLTSNDYRNREQVVVPPKCKDPGKYLDQIQAAFNSLTEKNSRKAESAVARGLINALAANSGRENREIIIISDGLENSKGISFYNADGLKVMDESNWPQLDEAFLKDMPQPDLDKATVSWYAPPSAKDKSENVRKGFKYWTHLLSNKLNASNVQMEFGV